MNRTDRLYALVEELRARAPRTVRAAELAGRFEVSVRTVERDLLSLQEAGVPIWAQPGPGGGYALDPLTTLPPLNFTPAEATAIATALVANGPLPFAEAGRSALQKLITAMSAAHRGAAAELAGRVRIMDFGRAPAPAAGTAVVGVVEAAVAASVAVAIAYEDKDGEATERIVEPSFLLRGSNGWYLMGWCRLRQAARGFRLDRIKRAELTAERIVPRPVEEIAGDIPRPLQRPALPG